MKRVLKKNRLMITVLALLVAAAGYLNYNGASLHKAGSENTKQTADLSAVTEDIDSLDFDITDTTALLAENQTAEDTKNTQTLSSVTEDTTENTTENVTGETVVSTLPVESVTEETKSDPQSQVQTTDQNKTNSAETSGNTKHTQKNDDIKENSTEKTDAASQETTSGVPGETVLTSTAAAYVTQARLEREQVRSKNREVLQSIIDNKQLSKQEIQDAVESMAVLTDYAEKEAAAETLLEAQGFANTVVSMTGDSVDVVVDAESLNETDRARIEDAVKRKTGVNVDEIVITPVRSQK